MILQHALYLIRRARTITKDSRARVAGGGMDELQNHSLQTMNLVWRGNAIGSTGFAAVAPRLKALLYGVAERVEQKPLLHICHHMNGTALWRFEHMPLVVVSE